MTIYNIDPCSWPHDRPNGLDLYDIRQRLYWPQRAMAADLCVRVKSITEWERAGILFLIPNRLASWRLHYLDVMTTEVKRTAPRSVKSIMQKMDYRGPRDV